MTLTLAPSPDLTTGDPYTQVFGLLINGQEPAGSVPVKAAIVSVDKSAIYIESVTCTVASAQTIAGTAYSNPRQAEFSGTQTRQLLSDSTDLSSALKKAITKAVDANGYGTVLLEIEVGSPYFVTRHATVSVGKGLIG